MADKSFIVDNSSDEKVIDFLRDWARGSNELKIATGYFEVGPLIKLGTDWSGVEKIQILIGDEGSRRTQEFFYKAFRQRTQADFDQSIEEEKDRNIFLTGSARILAALREGKIECRIYSKTKFHAKLYIANKSESAAFVGSSNFTFPGLTHNVELNVKISDSDEVSTLNNWFDEYWDESELYNPEVIAILEKHLKDYSPFEVYAKALQELFDHYTPSDADWEKNHSKIYKLLDEYQKEGYHSLNKIASTHNGAFLCDGVGLGKTFVGLMLIERLVFRDHKRVVLFVPKSGREPVWESEIKKRLPELLNGFLPFKIYNHTDLTRDGGEREFQAEFAQISEQADVVIIDEAHHFRNRGILPKEGEKKARYWRLRDVVGSKSLFMLTATPINNQLVDFLHLIELFSQEKRDYFARTLGIQNIQSHFQNLEKGLRQMTKVDPNADFVETDQVEAQEILFSDDLFRELVVQRSRAYARASQIQQGGNEAVFPDREAPRVAGYSIKETYGELLEEVEKSFSSKAQLFRLSVYYPLASYKGKRSEKESEEFKFDENRQRQLVRLIRIQFLKRFESSIEAFDSSCQTLLIKLIAFLRVNNDSEKETKRLDRWVAQNADIVSYVDERQKVFNEELESEETSASEIGDTFLEDFEKLPRESYAVEDIFDDTYADMEQLVRFIAKLRGFNASHDDKLQKLIKLLSTDKDLKGEKVLIFTEYMSTSRYLKREIEKARIVEKEALDEVDSGTKRNRTDIIKKFAPYYNGTTTEELDTKGVTETQILISTDVLSEGLNLQDATRLINYDIHWNPVRLMQRIGRVDRRLNPETEKKILTDHPGRRRGKVVYWNFLPPDDLDRLLGLFAKVSKKTLRISKVFGIEGKTLLTEKDDYEALKDFTHSYEGELSSLEQMHLDYQALLEKDPALEARLSQLPQKIFSGKEAKKGHANKVFFCYALPGLEMTCDVPEGQADAVCWTPDAGKTQWYLYDLETKKVVSDKSEEMVKIIESIPETPRRTSISHEVLEAARKDVETYIKNEYLKAVQAPIGVKPKLKCWMELN